MSSGKATKLERLFKTFEKKDPRRYRKDLKDARTIDLHPADYEVKDAEIER
jgi:hypothetical protein